MDILQNLAQNHIIKAHTSFNMYAFWSSNRYYRLIDRYIPVYQIHNSESEQFYKDNLTEKTLTYFFKRTNFLRNPL